MLRRLPLVVGLSTLLPWNLYCQPPKDSPAFEVASVKVAVPDTLPATVHGRGRFSGGPGTGEPGQFAALGVSLKYLIRYAYNFEDFQYQVESWMEDRTYDVVAKVPAGATPEKLRHMLQRLLNERFHMQVAHQPKSLTTYELLVAKGGPKLTPSRFDKDTPASTEHPTLKRDAEGIPMLPADSGPMWQSGIYGRQVVLLTNRDSLPYLADILSRNLKAPVVDRTGLEGLFEYRLHYELEGLPSPPGGSAPAPTMFTALEDQLGLKLEQHKQSVDVFVVTKADKIPTPD